MSVALLSFTQSGPTDRTRRDSDGTSGKKRAPTITRYSIQQGIDIGVVFCCHNAKVERGRVVNFVQR